MLISLLKPFSTDEEYVPKGNITKVDFFKYGLSGGANSSQKRERLLALLNLPTNMTANAMLSAINILYSKEEIEKIIENM